MIAPALELNKTKSHKAIVNQIHKWNFNKKHDEYDTPVDVVGITCNYDCLAEQYKMPQLEQNDVLAFLNTGSYIEPYTCNFNGLPRPGMVLVNGDECEWVKSPETQDEVFSRHVVPERLK